jgi:hypothetical protein
MKLHAFVEMLVGPVLVIGALALPTFVAGDRGVLCSRRGRDFRRLVAITIWSGIRVRRQIPEGR